MDDAPRRYFFDDFAHSEYGAYEPPVRRPIYFCRPTSVESPGGSATRLIFALCLLLAVIAASVFWVGW